MRRLYLLSLFVACVSCGDGSNETTSGSEFRCVDQELAGAVPLEIVAIDTREQEDDVTPSVVVGADGAFEDLVYAWTPTVSGEVELQLRLNASIPESETIQRKLYVLADCGGSPSTGGVVGVGLLVSTTAGKPVLFLVEGCEGDCVVNIVTPEPFNDS